VRSLARAYTHTAINRLVGLCTQAKSEAVQCQAAIALLERGWGRPLQAPADGGERIVVEVIYRSPDGENMKTIEHRSNGDDGEHKRDRPDR
jgi:hypothetical protein